MPEVKYREKSSYSLFRFVSMHQHAYLDSHMLLCDKSYDHCQTQT